MSRVCVSATLPFFSDGSDIPIELDWSVLIKCPECGADVSNRACACVKCGCSLGSDADEGSGTVIVYGLSQMNLIGGSLKIYANGVHAGTVKKHGVLEFSI